MQLVEDLFRRQRHGRVKNDKWKGSSGASGWSLRTSGFRRFDAHTSACFEGRSPSIRRVFDDLPGLPDEPFNWRLEPLWDRATRRIPHLSRPASQSLPEFEPLNAPDPLDEEVDDLLRKIHEHGEASLTDDERNVLKVAAEQYKKRRR